MKSSLTGIPVLATLSLLAGAAPAAASTGGAPPAGGAAIGQVIGATLGAAVATAALAWVIASHRSRRIKWLGRVAGLAERQTGLAGWASVPAAVLGASLLIAVFGMYWDISIHLDKGRDPGPLANPAHYFILVGLFGVFVCGALSIALARQRPSKVALELSPSWWAPLGAILILVCSAVSLIAFPLDDIWHRIFGQDVTLWGPTHLLLFGGAVLHLGARVAGRDRRPDPRTHHTALPPLPGRGGVRRARRVGDRAPPADHARGRVGAADRHGRIRGRVRLVAPVGAQPMAGV